MPRGDKSEYTGKQERKADHIAESYEARGIDKDEAEPRASSHRQQGQCRWQQEPFEARASGIERLGPRGRSRIGVAHGRRALGLRQEDCRNGEVVTRN